MQKILIADDDRFFREQLRRCIGSRAERSIEAVSSGKEAVEALLSSSYDLLVLDLHMQGLNGQQALTIIKNIRPRLPVIVVTGDDSLELERTIRAYGVFYYLLKPFDCAELEEAVVSALGKTGVQGG